MFFLLFFDSDSVQVSRLLCQIIQVGQKVHQQMGKLRRLYYHIVYILL